MAKEKLIIFDTTMRDGEQSPGASMTKEDKLRIARQLERMRVDVIEAGFPAASDGDFEAVQAVAHAIKESTVCGLARANERDIRRCGDAVRVAARPRVHTFIATSPIHMEKKLRMEPSQVIDQAVRAIKWAREYTDNVEFSPEDAGRSDLDFLCRILEQVIRAGATTINVPDTVGYTLPDQFGRLIRNLRERIPNADQVIWSVHCHNDLGLAVANSLSAVQNGARQVECTVNGLGERAVNASLEGVTITVSGYDASADQLLDVITANLVKFELPEERFLALKDQIVRSLQNAPLADAHLQVREASRTEMREFYFPPEQQLPLAQDVTLADVQAFARDLFAQGRIEAMIHGNVSADDALASARRVQAVLHPQPVPADALLERRSLTLAAGESLVSVQKLAVNNSAFRRQYVLGEGDPESRAAALVLSNFIGEPFYSEMRTRQQLGYLVSGSAGSEGPRQNVYFIIQSGDYPADEVQERAEALIAQLPDILSQLPAESWEGLVAGVRDELQQQDKSIAERTGRLFGLAYDHDGDWDRNRATLAALDTLTQARAEEILSTALAPKTRRMATYLGFGRDHEPAQPLTPSYDDQTTWKKTRAYQ